MVVIVFFLCFCCSFVFCFVVECFGSWVVDGVWYVYIFGVLIIRGCSKVVLEFCFEFLVVFVKGLGFVGYGVCGVCGFRNGLFKGIGDGGLKLKSEEVWRFLCRGIVSVVFVWGGKGVGNGGVGVVLGKIGGVL